MLGDMNVDIIKFSDDRDTLQYVTTMMSHKHLPYITMPTRLTPYSATCIDHIFMKIPDPILSPDNVWNIILWYLGPSSTLCLFLMGTWTHLVKTDPWPGYFVNGTVLILSVKWKQKIRNVCITMVYKIGIAVYRCDNTQLWINFPIG